MEFRTQPMIEAALREARQEAAQEAPQPERTEQQDAACGMLPACAPLANPFVPFQRDDPPVYAAAVGAVRGTLFPGLDLPLRGQENSGELSGTLQRDLQALDAESPLIVDEGRFQASWRNKLLDLTPAEFRLLKTLSQEPGKVFSREQLLNHLYDDYRVVTDRTIDSHIKNLRRKLESLDAEQSFIRAVYGVGYRWEADACRIV